MGLGMLKSQSGTALWTGFGLCHTHRLPYNPVRQFPIGVNRVALNHLTPLLEMQSKVLIHGVGNADKLEKQGSYHW